MSLGRIRFSAGGALKVYFFVLISSAFFKSDSWVAYLPFFSSALLLGTLALTQKKIVLNVNGFLCAAMFALFFLLVSIFGYDPAPSFSRIIYYFVPAFFILFSFSNVEDKIKCFRDISLVYCWAYALLVLIAIIINQYGVDYRGEAHAMKRLDIFGLSLSQVSIGQYPLLRLGSLVGNPNQFGFWGVIALTFSLIMRATSNAKRSSVILLFFALLGVYLSLSRSAIISSLAILVAYGLGVWGVRKVTVALTAGVLLLGLGTLWTGLDPIEVLGIDQHSSGSRLSLSVNSRDVAWETLLTSIAENPLLGRGITSASNSLLINSEISAAHSFYLQFAAEVGLIGLTFIIILFLHTLKIALELALKKESFLYEQAIILGSFLLMFYLALTIEVFLMSNLVVTSLWLLIVVYLYSLYSLRRVLGGDQALK